MSAPVNGTRARRAAAIDAGGPFGLLIDPALPHLAAALDPAGMAKRFAEGFAERARGPAPHVHHCEVEEVYYRPGRHCGILYRLQLNGQDAPVRDEWLYARLLPAELLRERYEKAFAAVVAAGASALVRSALEPVSLWEQPGMIVWTFPNDPKLPGLRAMADVAHARRRLARERATLGLRASALNGRSTRAGRGELAFERVKYMPTKRCVLRYREGDGAPATDTTPLVFFAKAYPPGGSGLAFRLQRAALERLAAARAAVELAEPLVHLAEESAVWFADWGGRGLIETAAERGWEEMAERAGAALAAFHRVAQPGIPDHATADDVLDEARKDAAQYAAHARRHAGLARGLIARLERGRPPTGSGRPAVALHGAFRAEHVLVRGAHTAFLDLDGMTLGDPLFDVAEFVASLEFLALRSATAPVDTERVSRRFLARYAASVPWSVDGSCVAWYALASIFRKLHGAVKRLASPTLARLESRGEALAERWSSLAGWVPRGPQVPRRQVRHGGAGARPIGVRS